MATECAVQPALLAPPQVHCPCPPPAASGFPAAARRAAAPATTLQCLFGRTTPVICLLQELLRQFLPETAAALKRTIGALMDRGAIVRNLENLGERALPYRMSTHSQRHSRGGYFLVDFYAPTASVDSIMDHLSRDIDVIRPNIVKHPLTQEVKECEGIVPVPLEEKLYSTKKRK